MKYLNLTKGFNPYNAEPQDCISFEAFTFSGGEPHIKLNVRDLEAIEDGNVVITTRIQSFNDLGLLAVAAEALDQSGHCQNKQLTLSYFPGARQDRRMVVGEPLTVKVYADIINEMGFSLVRIFDPHSDVTPALIDNVDVINNHKFVHKCFVDIISKVDTPVVLVSPDAGANKKVKELGQYLSKDFSIDIVKCDKTRDVTDGKITGFEICSGVVEGKTCVIVDDICDGGGTFIGLAEELRKAKAAAIYLVVSHGIFSKGFDKLNKLFRGFYTTDSFEGKDGVFKITIPLSL